MNEITSLIFYIFTFIGVIYLYKKDYNSENKIYKYLFYLIFVFIFGFRYGLGTDYGNYVYLISKLNVNLSEPLNYILYLPGYIFDNCQITFSLYQFFTIYFFVKSLKTYFNNFFQEIVSLTFYLFFVYPTSLNTVREGLALTILLYSFVVFLKSENKKESVIYFGVACLIHNLCLITIPMYFGMLYFNKLTYKTLCFYLLIVFAFYLLATINIDFILFNRIRPYFQNNEIDWGIGILIINLPIIIFSLYLLFKEKKNTSIINICIISLTGIIVRHLSYVSFYFYRLANPFNIINTILISYVPIIYSSFFNNKFFEEKKLYIIFLLFCISYFIFEFYFGTTGEIMRYDFRFYS